MTIAPQTLDVRPILKAGGEPFPQIMQAIAKLQAGQGLRLLATFKPEPLFAVMKNKGYSHSEKALDGGDWEVIFTPAAQAAPPQPAAAASKPGQDDAAGWPEPSHRLDNRGLMPPEPMVITMEAVEGMASGEVLECLYDREPLLLYPELQSRGHFAHCDKLGPSEYRVLIRVGSGAAV
ncbi:MAG TPA: DUF2249 domain-containing protein [Burkholderiaceae bacterium]|jgi:uncharacterized protein (DUF2249 family)|nr:DUF2249 domain-containing protein [Burkholderiaceae bacterium]